MNIDPQNLRALAAILRLGRFELAAAELGVTPSAISQRIRSLEEQVGAALIRRGSPCTATEIGTRLARHAEEISLLEAQLSKDLGQDTPAIQARLRIAVNADSLATWVIPALRNLPDLLFDLVVDDEEFSAEWLRSGEVNAAVTASGTTIAGCDSYPLGALRYVATASPEFVERWFAKGVTLESLALAPMLAFSAKDSLQGRWLTKLTGENITPPSHFVPSAQAFVDAALAGLGWGMNPETLVKEQLASGELVSLSPDIFLDIPLEWQVKRLRGDVLKPVTKAIREGAKQTLRSSGL